MRTKMYPSAAVAIAVLALTAFKKNLSDKTKPIIKSTYHCDLCICMLLLQPIIFVSNLVCYEYLSTIKCMTFFISARKFLTRIKLYWIFAYIHETVPVSYTHLTLPTIYSV